MKLTSLLAALSVFAPGAASAQYKCTTPGGGIAFQQTPCDRGAREQKLDVRAPGPPTAAASRPESPDERLARNLAADRQRTDLAQRRQDLRAQIDSIDAAIAQRSGQMNAEMDALRARKSLARNNLAGATYEQSVSTEMQAVATKYRALNEADAERQRALRNDLAALR